MGIVSGPNIGGAFYHPRRISDTLPHWRPFVVEISKSERVQLEEENQKVTLKCSQYSLSQNALQLLFATLSSLYNYLIQEE